MTKAFTQWTVAGLGGMAVVLAVLASSSIEALAVSKEVRRACRSDYFAHCSMHSVGSPALRQCMRAVGKNLSRGCIDALIAAGEYKPSKTKIARK